MRNLLFLVIFGLLTIHARAQNTGPDRNYVLQSTHNQVQYKNYYLLTLFQKDAAVKKMLQNDPVLQELLKGKILKINTAIKTCSTQIGCFTDALKFSESEVAAVSERLRFLLKSSAMGTLVKNQLKPSGCYILYHGSGDEELLVKAWEQDARSVNHTISVYAGGQRPNYPAIDSIGFNVKDKSYPELVSTNALLSLNTENNLFFEPSMQFALVTLEINERNDAADYEPMASTVNKTALQAIPKTNFGKYPYSLILVPGEGPEEQGVELSAGGMLRCRLAAAQYRKGAAPFIMVSGGRVHPYKTKYSEAFEMKKFLMQQLRIPESAILMEPHARHTTTNLRNAARILFRYQMPMEKPALVVTVKSQSMYISDVMLKRCVQELGYEPYKVGKRLSDQELEFYPDKASLQIDFDEPMDP